MSDIENIARQIDRHPRGLQIEVRDLWDGRRFVWNGSHTVNIFDFDGNEVDMFSVGDFADDRATLEQFLESVVSHVDEEIAEVRER